MRKRWQLYNRAYAKVRRDNGWHTRLRNRLRLNLARRFLRGAEELDILDVGCGDGSIARALTQKGHHVVGVDVNFDNLRGGRQTHIVCMDAGHLAFRYGCFDRILAFDVLEHIPRPDQVIAEFDRVLSSQGQVLLIYPWEPIRGITAIGDALQAYASVWKARKLHVQKLYPGKIEELVKGSHMKLVGWKLFLGPSPAFATVLRRPREGDRNR